MKSASRIRFKFSDGLNYKSVAHTVTSYSLARKIDDAARPHPKASMFIPDVSLRTDVSQSTSQIELRPHSRFREPNQVRMRLIEEIDG
jgi:hypothetical protein